MNVLVDTSVSSLARRIDDAIARELAELIQEGRVITLGPVRQELLSGSNRSRNSSNCGNTCVPFTISNSIPSTTKTRLLHTTVAANAASRDRTAIS